MKAFILPFYYSLKIILLSGFIAGSLDILAAFIDHYINTNKGPEGVLKFIASGVFGSKGFTNNSTMIWFGLLFHFIIALAFTTLFFILYPRVKLLRVNVLLLAMIIGVFIWLVMNLLILPLSNTPKFPFKTESAVKSALILIFMIGLPLSITFKRIFKNTSAT